MNKAELVDNVAEKTGSPKAEAGRVLDAYLEEITHALTKGEQIVLVGFGTFKVSDRAARTGRNPQTGEPIQIAASKAVTFKTGKALKDAVNA